MKRIILKAPGHRLESVEWSGEYGPESSSTGTCRCGWSESASSRRGVFWEYRCHIAGKLGVDPITGEAKAPRTESAHTLTLAEVVASAEAAGVIEEGGAERIVEAVAEVRAERIAELALADLERTAREEPHALHAIPFSDGGRVGAYLSGVGVVFYGVDATQPITREEALRRLAERIS